MSTVSWNSYRSKNFLWITLLKNIISALSDFRLLTWKLTYRVYLRQSFKVNIYKIVTFDR